MADYQIFHDDAAARKVQLVQESGAIVESLDIDFGNESLRKAFGEGLRELTRKNMLPSKLAILLDADFSR